MSASKDTAGTALAWMAGLPRVDEAVLIGSGPSSRRLTESDWLLLPSLRIALNHAWTLVPGLTATLAIDVKPAREISVQSKGGEPVIVLDVIAQEFDLSEVDTLNAMAPEFACARGGGSGSFGLVLLKAAGARTVHLVGFDSFFDRPWIGPYASNSAHLKRTADVLQIDLVNAGGPK